MPLGALPLGVVVKDFLVEGGSTYSVSLVGLDGRVATTATAAKRSRPAGVAVQMPSVSASNSRLYYLDGDSKVMYLLPSGAKGLATSIAIDSSSAAVFAVSPDDARIAVGVITFPYPAKTRIYVEDLAGGGHHVELFSSGDVIEWPAGWHQGQLVVAVGLNRAPLWDAYEGFLYGINGYHVVDAGTGARMATVCDGSLYFPPFVPGLGPPGPAGAVCVSGSSCAKSNWNGVTRDVSCDTRGRAPVLAPDGGMVGFCGHEVPAVIFWVIGDSSPQPTPYRGCPAGWIDATHVVVIGLDGSLGVMQLNRRSSPSGGQLPLDVDHLVVVPIHAKGFFAGTIPGEL